VEGSEKILVDWHVCGYRKQCNKIGKYVTLLPTICGRPHRAVQSFNLFEVKIGTPALGNGRTDFGLSTPFCFLVRAGSGRARLIIRPLGQPAAEAKRVGYLWTCELDSDDSGDLASDGHGPIALAAGRRHRSLVDAGLRCSRLHLDQQLVRLAVLVHRYRYHLLLHATRIAIHHKSPSSSFICSKTVQPCAVWPWNITADPPNFLST